MLLFNSNNIPASSVYVSLKRTLVIPACIISLAHSMQGERVLYNVAPSELTVPFANLHNALASACITSC